MEYVLEIAAILLASALVMILHELPKSIMYVLTSRHCRKEDRFHIFKLHQYIDPIGMIMFVICHAGASRPYPYRLKEKDTNIAIGMIGFLSLIVMILGGYIIYLQILTRFPIVFNVGAENPGMYLLVKFSWYFIYASIALFIVNLFPTATSDIFLLIVAVAPSKLVSLLKYDSVIKVIMFMFFIFQYIQSWSLTVMDIMYEFLGFI